MKRGGAGMMAELIRDVGRDKDVTTDGRRSILANLKPGHVRPPSHSHSHSTEQATNDERMTIQVISPRSLSPEKLLEPYPARPKLDLAYPLGLPVPLIATHDPFIHLSLSPLISPLNPHLRSDFCSSMGKILGRGKTGLGRKSQRGMGKAVRRARCMGVVPMFGKLTAPKRRGY